MAVGRYIAHRKLADGSYEDVYTKSESGLIYRPNGRTVEQDLAAYLPEYQNSDDVPKSLTEGKSIVTPNHVYTKLGNGTIRDLTLDTNTDTIYTHPSYKVCNYSYTHPSEKQCNYNVDLSNYVTKSEITNLKAVYSSGNINTQGVASSNRSNTFTENISYSGLNSVIGVIVTAVARINTYSDYAAISTYVESYTTSNATVRFSPDTNSSYPRYMIYYNLLAIGT